MKIMVPYVIFFGVVRERDENLLKLPKLHPRLNFFFFLPCVLKAQLSQVLEEVGSHKQRAEMVSVQFLPFFFSFPSGCFTEQ